MSATASQARCAAAADWHLPEGVEWVVLATPDLNGTLRGKAFTTASFEAVVTAGCAPVTDLIFATDVTDAPITTSVGVGASLGAKDLLLCPELSTLRQLPWRREWAWCLASARWRDGTPCEVSPRVACASALDGLRRLGYQVRAAFEYEFRLYRSNGDALTSGLSYSHDHLSGDLADFVEKLGKAAGACGLNVGAFHTEAGPGLMEINLAPADGITAADQALLLKACISAIAHQSGLRASFLAKPKAGEEGAGGHLHVSLLDEEGANIFAGGPTTEDLGEHLKHAVGGLLRHMDAASIFYNPHINSYKRLIPGWFAPVTADWGIDDRATAVRVIAPGQSEQTHLEIRRPGADANPHLVLAAAAVSITLGLRHRIVPPDSQVIDAHELPRELRAALSAFAIDDALRESIGCVFCDQFRAAREWELSAWNEVVTDWEIKRAEGPLPLPTSDIDGRRFYA